MSTVNGFQVGSETLKYNYESLDNYNTPNFSTSSSKTYAVGDYVMYNGKLYKCTTATTGGTWVSGSWTEAVLSDDVSDLVRELSDVPETLSLDGINAYADMATRKLIADTNSKTFLLDITRPDVERYMISINGNSNRCRILAFVEPIASVGVGSAGIFTDLGNDTKQFVLDKSNYASYKTISITTNYQSTPLASSVDVILIHDESLWENVINDESVISGLSKAVSTKYSGELIYVSDSVEGFIDLQNTDALTENVIAFGKNLINIKYAEFGTIDSNTGDDIDADKNYRCSNYIPVFPNTRYIMSCKSDFLDGYGMGIMRLSYYDENKNHISRETHTGSEQGLLSSVFITPSNAKYARWSVYTASVAVYDMSIILNSELMLEAGSVHSVYETYKESIATVNNGVDSSNFKSFNDATWIWSENYTDTVTVLVPRTIGTILFNDINELNNDINGLYKSIENKFSGEVIVADSVSGYINFNEIPQVDCTVKSIGKNLFNYETAEYGTINAETGEDDDSFLGAVRSEDFLPVLPSTDYTMSAKRTCYWLRLALYDENKTFIERIERRVPDTNHQTIRTTKNAKYARLIVNVQSLPTQPSYSIQSVGIMFAMGSETPVFEDYRSSSVTISNGIISGQLKSYNESTLVHADYETSLSINIPINVVNYIETYSSSEESSYTETECRERFRLEMREKAKRIGMSDTVVGDGAGHPVNTTITALDSIKMLCHAMSYQEIANTWSYDTKIIRTKGVANTITMNSTLFKDTYISDLTNYYTVLGFKTGSGSTHNLVCACTSDDLNGKVLVGCIVLSQVTDDANINRPKAMKTLMDMGKALVANRSADVSSYVSALTAMTATRFTVVLLPNCNTKLLQRYNFNGNYSMLYNYSSATFISWSMIKLLCAMTALDFMKDLDEANTVVYSDLLIGTGAYGPLFQEGEIITYRDAISALLIPSCNQAAYFLERLIGKKILNEYGVNGFLPTE